MLLHRPIFILSLLTLILLWQCEGEPITSYDYNSTFVSDIIEKRQFSTHAATNKKVKSVVSTFRETVIRLLLYNKYPQGQLLGIATAFIMNLILPQGRKLSAWEQVEEKVKNMVHDKLNDNNIAHLRDDWNIIGEALQNSPSKLNTLSTYTMSFLKRLITFRQSLIFLALS